MPNSNTHTHTHRKPSGFSCLLRTKQKNIEWIKFIWLKVDGASNGIRNAKMPVIPAQKDYGWLYWHPKSQTEDLRFFLFMNGSMCIDLHHSMIKAFRLLCRCFYGWRFNFVLGLVFPSSIYALSPIRAETCPIGSNFQVILSHFCSLSLFFSACSGCTVFLFASNLCNGDRTEPTISQLFRLEPLEKECFFKCFITFRVVPMAHISRIGIKVLFHFGIFIDYFRFDYNRLLTPNTHTNK